MNSWIPSTLNSLADWFVKIEWQDITDRVPMWPVLLSLFALIFMLMTLAWMADRRAIKASPMRKYRGSPQEKKFLCDLLVDGLLTAEINERVTRRGARKLYKKLAAVLDLPDLRPISLHPEYFKARQRVLKDRIKRRLGQHSKPKLVEPSPADDGTARDLFDSILSQPKAA